MLELEQLEMKAQRRLLVLKALSICMNKTYNNCIEFAPFQSAGPRFRSAVHAGRYA